VNPTDISPDTLFIPLLVSVLLGLFLTTLCSPQSKWIRAAVYLLSSIVMLRYLFWRTFDTLNFDTPINACLGITLLSVEFLMVIPDSLANYMMFVNKTDRSEEADRLARQVESGQYVPSVDVYIATYNEAEDMLERTIIGCQALDYPNKTIYVLDDGRREHIRALTQKLGCAYFTRPDNKHYKAGNLNNAFVQTTGELIAFFDADFVPCKDFLNQTVGFFQNPETALVQTPQHFYNEDPIESNLGLHGSMTNEQEVFFRLVQPGRDVDNSAICCGTSYVARRKTLEEMGGIPTLSITEDYLTSLDMQTRGHRVVYLNKILSAGDAPASIGIFINQRVRWCTGFIQILFTRYNAMVIKGLKPMQRYYHYFSHLSWMLPVLRLVTLLMPLAYMIFGFVPLKSTLDQIIYYFFPIYCLNLLVSNWLHGGKRSPFWTDVYSCVMMVPIAITWVKTLLNPFGKGFSVTPKPLSTQRLSFQWDIALPLFVIFMLYMVGFVVQYQTWSTHYDNSSTMLNIFWGIYNCIVMWVAILACVDIPQDRCYVKRDIEQRGMLVLPDQTIPLTLHALSEKFATVSLPSSVKDLQQTELYFTMPQDGLSRLPIRSIVKINDKQSSEDIQWKLVFSTLGLEQKRQLIEYLYCQPGQWAEISIQESRYTWNFVKSVFRLYPLTNMHSSS